MQPTCHYECLDRAHPDRGWHRVSCDEVMDALCKTYRDAVAALELLAREGMVLSTPYASYRHVIDYPDAGEVKES